MISISCKYCITLKASQYTEKTFFWGINWRTGPKRKKTLEFGVSLKLLIKLIIFGALHTYRTLSCISFNTKLGLEEVPCTGCIRRFKITTTVIWSAKLILLIRRLEPSLNIQPNSCKLLLEFTSPALNMQNECLYQPS